MQVAGVLRLSSARIVRRIDIRKSSEIGALVRFGCDERRVGPALQ
jgi:hypothetical protein